MELMFVSLGANVEKNKPPLKGAWVQYRGYSPIFGYSTTSASVTLVAGSADVLSSACSSWSASALK